MTKKQRYAKLYFVMSVQFITLVLMVYVVRALLNIFREKKQQHALLGCLLYLHRLFRARAMIEAELSPKPISVP